jgi:hypothetical protein
LSNPTGSTYLSANPSYIWADGDVYEIQQTDQAEGAATNASFSGLGVENQPHQFLLNKINYLKQNLVQANSIVGVNGWYRITSLDANLGKINIIEQWGIIPANQVPNIANNQSQVTFSFPLVFPNACFLVMPYLAWNNNVTSLTAFQLNAGILVEPPLGLATNTLVLAWQGTLTQFNNFMYGIGWRALGY